MARVLKPSDRAAIVGVIDPDALTVTTHDTGWIDMGKFEKLMAIIFWGDLGENALVDAKFEQAKDSAGLDAKDITGRAITQVDATLSPQPNNQQAIINLVGEDMDVDNEFTHARLQVEIAANTSDGGAIVLGFNARYEPGKDDDLASVTEIIH